MNKTQLKTALPLANKLQSVYTEMGIPTTQNVRNPVPMRALVELVIPKVPLKMCGEGQISLHAKSVDQISDDLKKRGFVINSRQQVLTALCNNPKIQSIPEPREITHQRLIRGMVTGMLIDYVLNKSKNGSLRFVQLTQRVNALSQEEREEAIKSEEALKRHAPRGNNYNRKLYFMFQ